MTWMTRRGTAWCLATTILLLTGCAPTPPVVVVPVPPVVDPPPIVVTPPSPEPPEPEPPPPVLATLAVEVLDSRSGQPVVGAAAGVHTGETAITNDAGYASWVLAISDGGRGVTITHPDYEPGFSAFKPFLENRQHTVHLVPTAPPVPPVTPPWTGQLRKARDDLGFQDASGAWVLPVCAHYGEAFSAFVHGKMIGGVSVEQQLRRIKAFGYDCIRWWDGLGYYDQAPAGSLNEWVAWAGAEVTPWSFTAFSGRVIPATPGYYERLRDFLALLQRLGLASHHSRGDLNAIRVDRVIAHTQRIAAIYGELGAWDSLALAEANNENFQNGSFTPDELRRIVEPFKAHGALTAHSSAEQAEEPDAIAEISAGASIYAVHGARGPTFTAILEHIFSLGYFEPRTTLFGAVQRLGIQGEPAGPGAGVSVGRVNDPEMLAMMAATALGTGHQWWTYMSGFGVFWEGLIETQPGFAVVPRIRAAIAAFAPDVMAWRLFHGGRAEAALKSPTGYDGDPGNINGPARIFNAVSPDRRKVVAVVEGGKGLKRVQNMLGCSLHVTVIGVHDNETLWLHQLTLQPDESFIVDYRVGRLLLGACQ